MKSRFFSDRAVQLASLKSQGWTVLAYKTAPVVVAFHTLAGKIHAKGWSGKADNPAFYYSFRSEANARVYVDQFVANVMARGARKAEHKAARKAVSASDFWAVGDVVYNSWGYDQTNVDFYQVVEVKAKSIVLREVRQNSSDRGMSMSGATQPVRNDFCGEPFTKLCGENGSIAFPHGGSSKWDGRPKYTSSYA